MPEEELNRIKEELNKAAEVQTKVLLETYKQLYDKVPGNTPEEKMKEINDIIQTTTDTMRSNTKQFSEECIKLAGDKYGK